MSHQGGVSLIEMVIVVAILGVVAAIVVPSLSTGDARALDVAAQELAQAIRFARSEAIRLNEPRGFRQQSSARRVRVFSLDDGTTPPTPVYDVYHPVTRQLYDIEFDNRPFAAVNVITRSTTYRGTCNKPGNVYFDMNGAPWCADPSDVLLRQYDITLSLAGVSRVVTLSGFSGRVTVQ